MCIRDSFSKGWPSHNVGSFETITIGTYIGILISRSNGRRARLRDATLERPSVSAYPATSSSQYRFPPYNYSSCPHPGRDVYVLLTRRARQPGGLSTSSTREGRAAQDFVARVQRLDGLLPSPVQHGALRTADAANSPSTPP